MSQAPSATIKAPAASAAMGQRDGVFATLTGGGAGKDSGRASRAEI